MAFSDLEILARILLCEAGGEGENGMKAVACVVMNRVEVDYGEYGRLEPTIRAVVYQPGQFDCVREEIRGQYNPQNIYNMVPEDIHYEIADWALAGNTVSSVGNSLFYFNPFSATCPNYFPSNIGVIYNRIGDHCFYSPTQA